MKEEVEKTEKSKNETLASKQKNKECIEKMSKQNEEDQKIIDEFSNANKDSQNYIDDLNLDINSCLVISLRRYLSIYSIIAG